LGRAWLAAASAEIALAAGMSDIAQEAVAELRAATDVFRSSQLEATSATWHGALLIETGQPFEGLAVVRSASLRWQQLGVPYEVARCRTWLARAYEGIGDHAAARLERDAARTAFTNLGAMPDLLRLDSMPATGSVSSALGLTARETQVLMLLSAGATNRAIATALYISEKTVARHLSNIYGKLGVGSRTEAMRMAFENGLVGNSS